MNILIIGSQGFIGSNLVKFFTERNTRIWQAALRPSQESGFFLLDNTSTDFDQVFKQENFDVCINASGSANVNFSFENPGKDFELNVLNVHKILVAIRNYQPQCKFINFSSAAVYGNPKKLPISEDEIVSPVSPYGFHKLQSEYLLTEYHKFFGLSTCSLRVFSAYGEGLKKQLFWELFQKLNTDTVELFGTGEESRDFIHIQDLLLAIDCIIKNADFKGNIYNLASGIETTIKDAAFVFNTNFENKKEIIFTKKVKIGDPNNWQADISKIKKIGFEPTITLDEGLKRYAKWLKEKG